MLENKYECTMDQILYARNNVAAMPNTGSPRVLFSFASRQHPTARNDVMAAVLKFRGGQIKKSDSVNRMNRYVFTRGIFLPNFILIGFEMMEP